MSSYLITGVSRGIGFEFLRQLSAEPSNTVFGLVRDKASTDKKVKAELDGRANIHILQADATDYDALARASDYVAGITGGSLDYVIANAAHMGRWSVVDNLDELAKSPARLTEDLQTHFLVNAVGPVLLFNVFLPLVERGRGRKAIAISSGHADPDLVLEHGFGQVVPYAVSKAALNMAVAKLSVAWAPRGVLVMAISPGVVATNNYVPETEEEERKFAEMGAKFQKAAPDWKGPMTPEESVKAIMSVVEKASVEAGDGGSFVSHHGNKQWL